MARVVPDIRDYVTLEQAGLLMKAAYEMGLKRGRCVPDARVIEIVEVWPLVPIVGGEG
jgi:hypothetical protein